MRLQESPKKAQESPQRAQESLSEDREDAKMELPRGIGDDFRDFGGTPALALLWAILRPQEGPREPQESPRRPQESPREPQESPREPQESPKGRLGLSWAT